MKQRAPEISVQKESNRKHRVLKFEQEKGQIRKGQVRRIIIIIRTARKVVERIIIIIISYGRNRGARGGANYYYNYYSIDKWSIRPID